MGATN